MRSYAESSFRPGSRIDVIATHVCKEHLTLTPNADGSYRLVDAGVSRIGTSDDYDWHFFSGAVRRDPTWDVSWAWQQLPESPISWLPRERSCCRISFTECPLNPSQSEPFAHWPQCLVDATHYLRPHGHENFFDYLQVRNLGWPTKLLDYLEIRNREPFSEVTDLCNRYRWAWTYRSDALELGDAVYQLATLLSWGWM